MEFSPQVEKIIQDLCDKHKVSPEMFKQLLQLEHDLRHLPQRGTINEQLRLVIKDYVSEEKL